LAEEESQKQEKDQNNELLRQLKDATGLLNMEGQIFWSQQQMLEKLTHPLAKRLVEVIHSIDMDKRTWKRVLLKYAEEFI